MTGEAASPEHVFAMKAFAARTRDEEDLRRLAEIIGIRSVAQAVDVCTRFFPSEPLPEGSKGVVEDLFSRIGWSTECEPCTPPAVEG